MIKPISAVKTQHVPQFGGISATASGAEADAQKVVHKGVTAFVGGSDLELLNKFRADDAQSTPRRSAARSFLDYVVSVVTGKHDSNAAAWKQMTAGDVFEFNGAH